MKEHLNRRTIILVGLTLLASAYLLYDLTMSGKPSRPRPKATNSPEVARAVEKASAAKLAAAPTAPSARRLAPPPPPDTPWGRDPFAIGETRLPHGPKPTVEFTGYTVSGVVWGPQGYRALINDRVVQPGDQVDGARIVRITAEGVELEKNGETRFFPLVEKGIFR